MKKTLIIVICILLLFVGLPMKFAYADAPQGIGFGLGPGVADGDWLQDAEVTFQGKSLRNAVDHGGRFPYFFLRTAVMLHLTSIRRPVSRAAPINSIK